MKRTMLFFNKFTAPKGILLISTGLLTLLMNLRGLFIALTVLVLIDLVTGITKFFYNNDIKFEITKKKTYLAIKSGSLRKTLIKSYEYGVLIIVGIIIELLIFKRTLIDIQEMSFSISQITILMPIGVEIWSIFENIESVTGNNMLKKIADLLPDKIRKLFPEKEE